ncbi:aldehyde dehydrogenase family protein [Sagittula sp. NFXS13]|uniref:aldehyde dehydrogenase family protein n=1 Tax=Sagittula sp. NFXS13 TaxID=2819095 RepID=UPI0032DF8F62
MTETEYKMLIDGSLTGSDLTLDVVNPATGNVFATVPRASEADAERAIAAAARAQLDWAALDVEARAQKLLALADAIESEQDLLVRTLVMEQGKPRADAEAEIGFATIFLRHFADQRLPVEVLEESEGYHIELHHRPLGVVAGIVPWNFPFLIAAYKLAPALILGNTFILKPAPTTPLTAMVLARIAQPILPAGVLSVLVDDNDLGPLLVASPDVAKVSFTGSTPTGRKIMQTGAPTLKRLTLELGGNDPGIVLPDADIEATAEKVFASSFMLSGQVCIALKRLYVHSDVYDQMCDALARLAEAAPVGDGLAQGTRIGPLQNKAQYEKAKGYLDVALRDGKVIAGGEIIEGNGYFMKPTIVRDIKDGSPLVDDEQFCPILPVIRFDDIDNVVSKANAGEFGLGSSVWSRDIETARDIAARLDSGTVWINHATHFAPHVPFGGAKQSGLGTEFGKEGLTEFAQRSVVSLAHA